MNEEYELILGFEIHLHLKLSSKMFCRCPADFYGAKPNTLTCPVCLGLPGALPVPNGKAVDFTRLIGLALGCALNSESKFDRKNYFYPDLPKGYQISQFDQPLAFDGSVQVNGKNIRIRRVHLEEDTGKSLHEAGKTYLDFNKSGVALVEVVTEPDFRTVKDATDFCRKIQRIVRYLDVSEANMEKGQMRLEPNISLRKKGETELPSYQVEVKNINSFRFLEKALQFEINRQAEILKGGEYPSRENRGWDEIKQKTLPQREKEEAHDYRYFPEPDIPPMVFDPKAEAQLLEMLPELPDRAYERLTGLGLSEDYAQIITDSRDFLLKFDEVCKSIEPKTAAKYLINKLDLREKSASEIVNQINEREKTVFLDAGEIEKIVTEVISNNPAAVEDFRAGKSGALMFIIGQVMKRTEGKADARNLRTLIESKLNEL